MSREPMQRTVRRPWTPHICGFVISSGIVAGWVIPAPAFATIRSNESSATSTSADVPWWALWALLEALDQILNGAAQPPPQNVDTEAANLAKAADQIARFEQSGIQPDLSESERAQGLADLGLIRSAIIANPEQFADPAWDDYLDTLEDIKIALD